MQYIAKNCGEIYCPTIQNITFHIKLVLGNNILYNILQINIVHNEFSSTIIIHI